MALRGPDGIETLLFGSGVDGAISFLAPAFLSADIYAETILIAVDIEPLGCAIFARDRIDHLTGSINANGSNATAGTGGPGAFGALFGQGANGGNGGTNAGGSNGGDVTIGLLASINPQGFGGAALINGGGSPGSFSVSGNTFNTENSLMCPLNHAAVRNGVNPYDVSLAGGPGGGGGGGDGVGVTGGGGGGGGGGVILGAPEIFLGGDINANGGNGSNGSGSGGRGGGGGGKGGFALLVGHVTFGGGSINVNGGNGSNRGGTGGFGGKGGGGGQIIFYSSGYLATRTINGTPGTNGTP